MNQRKKNISRWYALALAMVLTAGCLIASTGVAYGRYRTQGTRNIPFIPRNPPVVGLGVMQERLVDSDEPLQWMTQTWTEETEAGPVDREVYALDFAIYNDSYDPSDTTVEHHEICARVRLVATPDAWDPAIGTKALLVYREGETLRTLTAEVVPIPADTALYHDFGEGWIFRFLDEYGREASWELEFDTTEYIGAVSMQIILDPAAVKDTSLLQLQVLGAWAK